MQLLEDIVADLEGECNRLHGEIAQWQKLQKETLVCLELGNACFEDAVAKRHELLLDCERLREENLTLNGKLNQAMDDAMLAESELVDAYMKRSEMRNTLLDLKDKLTRFRNSNDDLRKKINDMRAQKRLVEVVDQLVNLI
jgi:chromosome segregation ATPase